MSSYPIMINAFDPSRASELRRTNRPCWPSATILGRVSTLLRAPVHFVRGEGFGSTTPKCAYLDAYTTCRRRSLSSPGWWRRSRARRVSSTRTPAICTPAYWIIRDAARDVSVSSARMYTCTGARRTTCGAVARQFTGARVYRHASRLPRVTDTIAAMSPSLGTRLVLGPHVRVVPARSAGAAANPWCTLQRPLTGPQVGRDFAAGVEAALGQMPARHQAAGLIVDTIFSSDGCLPIHRGSCRTPVAAFAGGGVFIADEVQPGFGRTGTRCGDFSATPRSGYRDPGKAHGQWISVAAWWRSPTCSLPSAPLPLLQYIRGSQVHAAARAVLEIIREERLRERAQETGIICARARRSRRELRGDRRRAWSRSLHRGELVDDRATLSPATRFAGARQRAAAPPRAHQAAAQPRTCSNTSAAAVRPRGSGFIPGDARGKPRSFAGLTPCRGRPGVRSARAGHW